MDQYAVLIMQSESLHSYHNDYILRLMYSKYFTPFVYFSFYCTNGGLFVCLCDWTALNYLMCHLSASLCSHLMHVTDVSFGLRLYIVSHVLAIIDVLGMSNREYTCSKFDISTYQ